jgi:hypothetical protein
MKRLSDYKGEDAIELWADLLDPITDIFKDPEVLNGIKEGKNTIEKAQYILKKHKKNAVKMILAIDPTPINGLNLIVRLVDVLMEIENSEEFGDFFGSPRPGTMENVSSGSVMESTGAEGK